MEKTLWNDGRVGSFARTTYRKLWVEITELPEGEKLWRSVYKKDQVKKDGSVKPSFFRDKRGLSCDLARLSTVEKSRRGYGDPPQWPEQAGLVEFTVRVVRRIGSDAAHRPLKEPYENYSHAELTTHLQSEQAKNLMASDEYQVLVEPRLR